jgi:putative component of membrane protein insertase Oxa1/YidC/SpoIIIJ protein YidD
MRQRRRVGTRCHPRATSGYDPAARTRARRRGSIWLRH